MGGYDIGSFVARTSAAGAVWTLRGPQGFPSPTMPEGERAMPFWSTFARAARIAASVPDYSDMLPVKVTLHAWLGSWLPTLERGEVWVGIEWTGPLARGFEACVPDVLAAFNACEPIHDRPALRRRMWGPQ